VHLYTLSKKLIYIYIIKEGKNASENRILAPVSILDINPKIKAYTEAIINKER